MVKKIFILTGAVNSGKTSAIIKIIKELSALKRIKGIYTPKVFKDENFLGYDLCDIESKKQFPFVRFEAMVNWHHFRQFYFNPTAIEEGNRAIINSYETNILVIDEIGPLELNGGGFRAGLEHSLHNFSGNLFLVCREHLLKEFVELMNANNTIIKIISPTYWSKDLSKVFNLFLC